MKVAGQVENDMVLGTSITRPGSGPPPSPAPTAASATSPAKATNPPSSAPPNLDGPAAETVAARARAARLAAGLLTGHTARIEPDPDSSTASILDHLATVWPVGEEKVWWDDLAERLAATYPGLYGTWTGEQVTAAVRPHGLRSIQIKRSVDGKQLNRRGLARGALAAVLDDRTTDGPYTWPTYTPPLPATPAAQPADTADPRSPATPDPESGYQ